MIACLKEIRDVLIQSAILFLVCVSVAAQTPVPPEQIYADEDALAYRGYRIARDLDARTGLMTATLERDSQTLARFSGASSRNSVRFGLFAFLGGAEKQLIIERNSGGAHCCLAHTIFDFSERHRVIYESTNYPVGNDLHAVDLDGDGVLEIAQSLMTFDYFMRMPFAYAPFPIVVFRFDARRARYIIANRRFARYVIKDLDESIAQVRELARRVNRRENHVEESEFFGAALRVTLDYIYAGRERDGWAFFEQAYVLRDKRQVRRNIERELGACPVHRALYPRRRARN